MNVLRAQAYIERMPAHEKVSDHYDDDDMLGMALSVLMPGFEYPDISHLTFSELAKKTSAGLPALVSN